MLAIVRDVRWLLIAALAGCAPDQVLSLEIPTGAQSLIWAIRDGDKTELHSGALPEILPRRSTTARIQVAGYAEALDLRPGVIRSSTVEASRPLPAPLFVVEGAYQDEAIEPLAPATRWAELAAFQIGPPGCPAVSPIEVMHVVSSSVVGAMATLGTDRVILGYGPDDFFWGARLIGLRQVSGPFAPTALATRGSELVVVGGAHGQLFEAELFEENLLKRLKPTATISATPIQQIALVGDARIVLTDDRLLRHESDVTTTLFDFKSIAPGALVIEPDGTIVAAHGTTLVVITPSGTTTTTVAVSMTAAAFSPRFGTTMLARRDQSLFLRTDLTRPIASTRDLITEMVALDDAMWLLEGSGDVEILIPGRRETCAPVIGGRSRHMVRSKDDVILATGPELGMISVRSALE